MTVVPSAALREAVEEFRSQTANLNKPASGTVKTANRPAPKPVWHGRLYENIRNDAFDANPHQIVQRGGEQRKLRRNQYGFSVTGPVVLPKIYQGSGKTFFTLSYEAMKESIGQFRMATIPTTLERTGSWSHVVDNNGAPLQIYDPASTSLNPKFDPTQAVSTSNLQYLRNQFPGNNIPLTSMDPVARAALAYYPQPNTAAGPFFQNNYYSVTPEVNRANGFITTVDHTFLQKQRVTVKLSHSNGLNGQAPIFNTPANPASPPQDSKNRGLNVQHVYTASPTNINTFALSGSYESYANRAQLDAAGRPFPQYNFNGVYQNMGQNGPVSHDAFIYYQLSDTFATRWKKHRLSQGVELTQQQFNSFRPQFPVGRFDFTSGFTSLPGIVNTGHPFASFLLGGASQAQENIVGSPSYYRWNQQRYIFSDQWQLRPSLTVTFGANWEVFTQRLEKFDRQSTISFSEINPANGLPGALVFANRGGYGRRFQPTWAKLEPSLGLAWSVLGHNNTVLRLSYDRRYGNPRTSNGHFGTQGFNGSALYLSDNPQLTPGAILATGLHGSQRFPDLRPDAANGTFAQYFDTSDRQPTAQTFNFSLQRQLAKFLILTFSVNHQNARNQFIGNNAANPNAIPLSALQYRDKLNDLAFNQAQRPYPQFQNIDVAGAFPAGRHVFTNWNIQLEKRTSGGLALTATYQHFNRWDDYSTNIQDYYDRQSAWARSTYANPDYVSLNFIYELPIGPGKPFLNSGPLSRQLFGGWALSDSSEFWSGSPIRMQPLFNNTGGVIGQGSLNVDSVAGMDPNVSNRSPLLWFNPAAFTQPADFTPGNASRTSTVLGPGGFNHDLTMNKRFAAGADRTLEFTASLFNATNHANWNYPDNRIGSAASPNYNAGRIIGSNGGRIVQLGLRLNF
ncbi:MAG: hypothetical protein ABI811_07215 [Acidobacteriota bacterium]